MISAATRRQIEARLARFGAVPLAAAERQHHPPLSCGIAEVDRIAGGGLPRGAITEIAGPLSSGRTTFLLSVLASSAARAEACALVDAFDSFDPASAASSGLALDRLLWARCAGRLDWVLRAADLLLEGGGWGVVALDLAGGSPADLSRIPSSYWFRFRRAIQGTATTMILVTPRPLAGSSALLALETMRESGRWIGPLLEGARYRVRRLRPLDARDGIARFDCRAVSGEAACR